MKLWSTAQIGMAALTLLQALLGAAVIVVGLGLFEFLAPAQEFD